MSLTLTQAAWLTVACGVLIGMLLAARLSASLHADDRRAIVRARLRLRMTGAYLLGVADSGEVTGRAAAALRSEARAVFRAADMLTVPDEAVAARDRHPSGSRP